MNTLRSYHLSLLIVNIPFNLKLYFSRCCLKINKNVIIVNYNIKIIIFFKHIYNVITSASVFFVKGYES